MIAQIHIKYISFFFVLSVLSGCAGSQNNTSDTVPYSPRRIENSVTVPGQKLPPTNIRSITFYKDGQIGEAPIIRLHSNDRLVLQFDDMSNNAGMFTVRLTHHNKDWSRSGLSSVDYVSSIQDQINDGVLSKADNPSYTHYRYTFPNESFKPLVSGNYLLHVYDFSTGNELFSLPFFVTEQRKQVETKILTLYNQEHNYLRHNQIFATYAYPEFVKFPQLDISIYFAQNQFWGRSKRADIKDISQIGVIKFHNSRDNLFVANYEFRTLNLESRSSYNILESNTSTIPPKIVLRRDIVNLDVNPSQKSFFPFGEPERSRSAEYSNVQFSLDVPSYVKINGPIYIYGSFNNWSIQDENAMKFDATTGLYTGSAFIKQGRYEYKYAVVQNGRIDDLRLDASFASTRQQYYTFVYFRDPEMHYDRLLSYNMKYSQ